MISKIVKVSLYWVKHIIWVDIKSKTSSREPSGTPALTWCLALQHYYRRFVTLKTRRCKVKFFRNRFVFIFADIFNNDVD